MLDGSIGTTRRARRGMLREWRLHALSVFSLAVAFVCLGAALLVLTNLRAIEERWAHAGRASIYLKDNAQPAEVEALKHALTVVPGITGVRYVSPAVRADDRTLGLSNMPPQIIVECRRSPPRDCSTSACPFPGNTARRPGAVGSRGPRAPSSGPSLSPRGAHR